MWMVITFLSLIYTLPTKQDETWFTKGEQKIINFRFLKQNQRPDTLLSDIWFQSIDYFDIKHTHTHTQKPKSV